MEQTVQGAVVDAPLPPHTIFAVVDINTGEPLIVIEDLERSGWV
jgi:hypothetical protein